jgi:hypothetical protein
VKGMEERRKAESERKKLKIGRIENWKTSPEMWKEGNSEIQRN